MRRVAFWPSSRTTTFKESVRSITRVLLVLCAYNELTLSSRISRSPREARSYHTEACRAQCACHCEPYSLLGNVTAYRGCGTPCTC
jgi:hypothetical protein